MRSLGVKTTLTIPLYWSPCWPFRTVSPQTEEFVSDRRIKSGFALMKQGTSLILKICFTAPTSVLWLQLFEIINLNIINKT